MPEITNPGDYRVGPHIIRLQTGQVCAYPSNHDVESIAYADAYDAAIEAEAATIDPGAEVEGEFSKINSNPFTPSEEPTTFVQDADAITAWVVGVACVAGSKYSNVGREFICRQTHIPIAQWEPVEDLVGAGLLALWTLIPEDSAIWESGVSYQVGDEVDYLGTMYRCLQAHTSIPSWTPPAVPALWEVI